MFVIANLLYKIGGSPIIAAVRDLDKLEAALMSRVDNVFFMGGDIKQMIGAVERTVQAGKGAFVHLDLVRGLSSTDKESIDFISNYVGAHGIISPKNHLIKEAKRAGLYGILHLFILDSLALKNGMRLAQTTQPDAVEVMPGLVPKVVQSFAEELADIPVIASGLIATREEAAASLNAGATTLSVSNEELWDLTFRDIDNQSNTSV